MKAEEIFTAALAINEPADRTAYLDRACGDEAELRTEVEALLRSAQDNESFLEKPVLRIDATTAHSVLEKPGDSVGAYKLLQEIGVGGFGTVFMAEQTQPVRRKVALKVIKPGMDSQSVVARFEAERQALALMEHPNIARVFDGGSTAGGRPYFVMELVKGVPITEYCDRNGLPTDQRLQLFTAVCKAVQHAHQKGIIHRDLKPSNVLVTLADGEPVVKVIDFGVAKATNQQLTEKTLFTAFGQMVGTPQYMSPEQAEMSCLDVDTRSDIYSLGVLLYELLTGTPPLEARRLRTAGYAEMQRLIREEEPPKPSTRLSNSGAKELTIIAKHRSISPEKLKNQVKGDLDWIVMKTLEKDRNRRYASALSLAADVARVLTDEPVEARPPSRYYQARKFVVRNRLLVSAASLVSLALIVGLAVALWGLQQATRSAKDAKDEQLRAEGHLATLHDVIYEEALEAALARNAERLSELLRIGRSAGVSEIRLNLVLATERLLTGEAKEAHKLVTTIVEVEPQNVAALGLLTYSQLVLGYDEEFIESLHRLAVLEPKNPEDYLFKALPQVDRSIELPLMEKAFELMKSPGVMSFLAYAKHDVAIDRDDPNEAREAIRFAEAAEIQLGETPNTLVTKMAAHHLLARHSAESEQLSHRAAANAAAESLLKSESPHFPWLAAIYYFDTDQLELSQQTWKSLANNGLQSTSLYLPSLLLQDSANASEALLKFDRILEVSKEKGSLYSQISRARLMAEIPEEQREFEALLEQLKRDHADSPAMFFVLQLMLVQGDRAAVQQQAKELLPLVNDGLYSLWGMDEAIRFLAGDCSEQRIVAAIKNVEHSKEQECVVRYVIGERLLLEGKESREKAIEQFRLSVDGGAWWLVAYSDAKTRLYRLQNEARPGHLRSEQQ